MLSIYLTETVYISILLIIFKTSIKGIANNNFDMDLLLNETSQVELYILD